jgi:hypothetical protein
MDVFHKVLARIYEISGGRETQEVDFIELLKKEGFYANRDNIKDQMSTEGWITDAARPGYVRITHWGMAEAKKSSKGDDKQENGIGQQIEKLKTAAHQLTMSIDELGKNTNAKSLKTVEQHLSETNSLITEIKSKI